jgi:nucleoside-diphosphate-sugar epimerase
MKIEVIGENGMLGQAIKKTVEKSSINSAELNRNGLVWAAGSIQKKMDQNQVENEMRQFTSYLEQLPPKKHSFILYLSSAGELYPANQFKFHSELSPICPKNDYGLLKQSQEKLLIENFSHKFDKVIILRLANVYGRDLSNITKLGFIDKLILSIKNKSEININVNLESRKHYGHKFDYAESISTIINNLNQFSSGEILNLAPNFNYSIAEIIQICEKHFNQKVLIGERKDNYLDTVLVNTANHTLLNDEIFGNNWLRLEEFLMEFCQ